MMALMRIMARIVPLTFFGLTLFTSSAFAECAWVLWTEREAMSKDRAGNWTSVSFDRNIYKTREACDVALAQWIERKAQISKNDGIRVFRHDEDSSDYKDHLMRIDILLRQVTEVFREKDTGARDLIIEQYTCLPDPIDLRGPKTK